MYAIIKTGGKQYKVQQGDKLCVEKLEAGEGATVEFTEVLIDGDSVQVGSPSLTGGKVVATVTSQKRGDKVRIVKMRRRKHYRRQMGHRQYYTEVEITGIQASA
jgi:large subunit ribosomal protein L21